MSWDRPKHLPNKPLVEAILEVKWGGEVQPDPAYPISVGRLYERLRHEYPEIENLPVAQVPAEMTTHIVRHRFRKKQDAWPLVQIGPGVLTLNDTVGYHWDDFNARARMLLPWLYDAHPSPSSLRLNSLLLRYINAVELDYEKESALEFLSSRMRLSIGVPSELVDETALRAYPTAVGLQIAFAAQAPAGALRLQVGTGASKGRKALIWEIHFMSVGVDVPRVPDGFGAWLDGAHAKIEDWFFGLAEGELLRKFLGS